MQPVKNKYSNLTLFKPAEMSDDDCGPLDVVDTGQEFVSEWALGWSERMQALFFGRVFLIVAGRRHPPVLLTAFPVKFEVSPDES